MRERECHGVTNCETGDGQPRRGKPCTEVTSKGETRWKDGPCPARERDEAKRAEAKKERARVPETEPPHGFPPEDFFPPGSLEALEAFQRERSDSPESAPRSRAALEEDARLIGTPQEVQERIEGFLRERGMPEDDIARFRELHSLEAVAAGLVDFEERRRYAADNPKVGRAYEDANAILDEVCQTSRLAGDRVDLLVWHAFYAARVEPSCACPLLEKLFEEEDAGDTPGGHDRMDVLREHVGWDGFRPVRLSVQAEREGITEEHLKGVLEEALEGYAYALEDLRRFSAYKNGRRYLWPEERGGA